MLEFRYRLRSMRRSRTNSLRCPVGNAVSEFVLRSPFLTKIAHAGLKVAYGPVNRSIANAYLHQTAPRKLQLGCGRLAIPGWLNTDIRARHGILAVDASKPLPFPDQSFQFIFTEHMIEHLPYQVGNALIRESFRILAPGGVIRIATPDLSFLVGLYQRPSDQLHAKYIKWSSEEFCSHLTSTPVSVVNNFVRNWGHQYIYDFDELALVLRKIGFQNPTRQQPGESSHPELRGLERHGTKIGEDFNRLETVVIEGTKGLS